MTDRTLVEQSNAGIKRISILVFSKDPGSLQPFPGTSKHFRRNERYKYPNRRIQMDLYFRMDFPGYGSSVGYSGILHSVDGISNAENINPSDSHQ